MIKNLFFFSSFLHAGVIPTGLDDSQSDVLIDSFNSVYSGANTKYSYALGKKAAVSISSSYLDLSKLSKTTATTPSDSDSLTISYLNIAKGLYHNFDLGLSSVLPTDSNEAISGFGGYINWLKIYKGFSFKPGAYLYNLNINNVYNSFNAGLSLSVFKQLSLFSLGLHYSMESNEVNINDRKNSIDIFTSGNKTNKDRVYNSIGASVAFEAKDFDVIIQPSYNFETDFILNVKLNVNL